MSNKLKAKSITPDGPCNLYLKSEVDVVLAKKDMEIFNLKEELSYIKADSAFDRDKHKELLKSKDAEIAELKAKLEDAKASAYAESVDAGMRERRLRRALYKALANWAICKACILECFCLILNAKKWERMYHKCREKAEEYK